MSDHKPDLSDEEVSQGDNHSTNRRVLIISVVVLVIAFIGVAIYNMAVTPTTDVTTDAGETIEEAAVEGDDAATPDAAANNEEPVPDPVTP